MSTVLNPVGPEDSQVYWKRRLLVGGVIVLALLILWLIFKPSGEPSETATAASSQSAVAPPQTASGSASASTSESASPSSSESSGTTCADADIGVEVTTSAPSYPSGQNPQISMAIANNGETPCDRDVGSLANAIDVSSGGVRVWSSDDCSTDAKADVVTLDPGQRATVTVDWPRTTSAPGCKGDQTEVDPGFYDALGRNGKVSSKKVSFSLQ
jgi:hypothetical protein